MATYLQLPTRMGYNIPNTRIQCCVALLRQHKGHMNASSIKGITIQYTKHVSNKQQSYYLAITDSQPAKLVDTIPLQGADQVRTTQQAF